MTKLPRDLDTLARMLATRLDRRRLVQTAGGMAAGAAAAQRVAGTAGAAGRPISSASARYQQAVKKGGTLVSMLVAEPTSMDIAAGIGQHNYALMSNVFENLLQYDWTTFDARPCLAESYDVSPDGMTYTFHLRKNVLFHDGTPMNADAVKFTYVRIMDPTNQYYKLGQPFPLIDFWYEAIDPNKIVVKDPYTVVFNLKKPHSTLSAFLAWPAAGIVSPTALQKYGKDFRTNPVGTGPFKYKQWVPNQRVEFTRFDQYWGGPAALDGLVFRPIIEEQTRVTELKAGNIDFAYDLPPDNVPQIKSSPDYRFYEVPLGHVWFLVLNTKSGPTANVKVRQAIAYAIDKNAIITDILKGTGVPATGPIPSVISYAYDKDVQGYAYNPDKAKALLKEAGYPNGFQTTFWATQSGSGMQSPQTMAEAIQANLGDVGINAKIQVTEWGAYLNAYAKGLPADVGMAEMSWFTTDARNIPNLTLTCGAVSPAGYNAGYYCNPSLDALVAQFTKTLDLKQQAQIMAKLQEIVATDEPNVYVDSQVDTAALAKKYDGFHLHPSQLLRFYTTHLA